MLHSRWYRNRYEGRSLLDCCLKIRRFPWSISAVYPTDMAPASGHRVHFTMQAIWWPFVECLQIFVVNETSCTPGPRAKASSMPSKEFCGSVHKMKITKGEAARTWDKLLQSFSEFQTRMPQKSSILGWRCCPLCKWPLKLSFLLVFDSSWKGISLKSFTLKSRASAKSVASKCVAVWHFHYLPLETGLKQDWNRTQRLLVFSFWFLVFVFLCVVESILGGGLQSWTFWPSSVGGVRAVSTFSVKTCENM